MLRTGVPETSVDEDGHPLGWEDDVGSPSGDSRNRTIYSKSQTASMESAPQVQFGRGVALPRPLHTSTYFR
jgi:hypothetical protein